jgi:hypothetical protein
LQRRRAAPDRWCIMRGGGASNLRDSSLAVRVLVEQRAVRLRSRVAPRARSRDDRDRDRVRWLGAR